MEKIMDIRDICEIIITYNLIFKFTNNIEKKRKNPKITIFEKNGGLLTPLKHFEYFWNYDFRDQRQILLEKSVMSLIYVTICPHNWTIR